MSWRILWWFCGTQGRDAFVIILEHTTLPGLAQRVRMVSHPLPLVE